MITSDIKDIVINHSNSHTFTKRDALFTCMANPDLYIKMLEEIQKDQDIIYACLAYFKCTNKSNVLVKILENVDFNNIDLLHQLANALDNYSVSYVRNVLLEHINIENHHELPYQWMIDCRIRNFIFSKTSEIIKKEIISIEGCFMPFKVTHLFPFADIRKFTVKPCAYDIFIKIE